MGFLNLINFFFYVYLVRIKVCFLWLFKFVFKKLILIEIYLVVNKFGFKEFVGFG